MHATERNYGPRAAVPILAPFRFLVAIAMALLVATVIASSTARAMLLGEPVTQSALGVPLRVVIPIKPAPGESLEAACFRIVPNATNASAPIVTPRVSLERAAATPWLVVTTPNAVNEPAVQFTLQAGCDGTTRRNYVLLLDPPALSATAGVAVDASAHTTTYLGANPTAREPRQERSAPPGAARRNADSAALGATLVVHAPAPVERAAPPAAAPEPIARGIVLSAVAPVSFRQIAVSPAIAAASSVSPPAASPSSGGWNDAWTYLAASLAIMGVVGLAALFMRQRDAMPTVPQWTRGGSYDNGPRTYTNLSTSSATASATASHTLSHAAPTTMPATSLASKPRWSTQSLPATNATLSRREFKDPPADPSTIDTLLGDVDADMIEERAVREAWAAARIDAERESEKEDTTAQDDAILQAIEDAERDLLLAPPAPAQYAIDNALDEDLLAAPRRPDKAAA